MCTMQMLMELAETGETLPLVNKTVLGDEGEPLECGRFGALRCVLNEKASFLDYLHGGLELNFVVAIDYTASNGDPTDPESLHHIPKTGRILNPYISAIRSVSSVLEFYDFDREFPCYGFGAKLTKSSVVDHCFPLSGDDSSNFAVGTEGIIEQYRAKTPSMHFSGPTVFTNVVCRAASLAKSLSQTPKQKYVVLMIITDGTINDMDNCIDAIVSASKTPLSIIIVGVGDDDFSGMVKLDSDKRMLKSRTGKVAERDIVQFTSLQDMQKIADEAKKTGKMLDVHDLVSRDLLAEIPAQVTEYYSLRKMPPNHNLAENSFSRESSKSRVQEVREQIAQAQTHSGIIDAPLPQAKREEGYKKTVNDMLREESLPPGGVHVAQASAEVPPPAVITNPTPGELPPTYSTVFPVSNADADGDPVWYDTTDEVREEPQVSLLPTYSALDINDGGAPVDIPAAYPPNRVTGDYQSVNYTGRFFLLWVVRDMLKVTLTSILGVVAGTTADDGDEWFDADNDA